MHKKILFISYDGMTDPLGQSQVIPYLQGLSKNGFCIYLLSCEKSVAFQKNKLMVEGMLEGFPIEWTPLAYTKKPPVLATLKDIIQLKKAAQKIHQQVGIDMVHTRPGIPALVGMWMKNKMGVKFLHDIREFYADSRVDGGMWNLRNPLYKIIYRYFKQQEKKQLENCDGIVCLTHAAQKIILQLPEYNQEIPLSVIPCSVDLNLFDPAKINPDEQQKLQQQLGIGKNDFVFSYLGSIGGWYLTAEMMRFCKLLSNKIPSARFLFISPHLHETIFAEAEKAGLQKEQIIIRHGSRNEVPILLSLSNYSVFFIRPCYSKLSSSPTKHGEIMAMGIPVITNSGVGDVQDIIKTYNSGYVLENISDVAMNTLIDEIIVSKKPTAAMIRNGAVAIYDLQNAVKSYTDIYNKILC